MGARSVTRRLRQAARPRARYREVAESRAQHRETAARGEAYQKPLDETQVLYQSFGGNGMLCNPEAIFRYLLGAPDLQHLHHVWALDDLDRHDAAVSAYADHPRVRFVAMDSPDYVRALATSKYLINNATFGHDFAKREEQIYLNTWHGVPLKKMGYDLEQGGPVTWNILRNMLSADYVLSACAYMTDRMYRRAFRLQGIFGGQVIEEGQPRTDRQGWARSDPQGAASELRAHGLDIQDRRVILYAPTWKGESMSAPDANSLQMVEVVRKLQGAVGDEHLVLLKAHESVYDAIVASGDGPDILVSNDVPTNLLLGVTDLLITDYSSILFDFLPLGRPLLHHAPDLETYAAGRGLYLDESELFGPVSRTIDCLVENVQAAVASPFRADAARERAVDTYAPHEDGSVTERVVDVVFRGVDARSRRVVSDFGSSKPSMLIYLGALTSNGLTASALNLLRHLDYDRFDVSVLYHAPRRHRDRLKNQALIDERCRQIVRTPEFIATPRAMRAEQRRMERGLPARLPESHREFWQAEWRRVFGAARFDHGLDLSGYGTLVPYLFINGDIGSRAMWLHSDLLAESERETNGVQHLKQRLNAVFSTFSHFDRLVSVSAELNRVNSQKLARFAPPGHFSFASNTIDCERVLAMSGVEQSSRPAADGGRTVIDTSDLSSAVATMLEHFEPRSVIDEIRSQLWMPGSDSRDVTTFVTVGRLSPEKNQARLIRAFAQVQKHEPGARLLIIGRGKLEDKLRELTRKLGVRDFVRFTGHVDNPYALMAKADCFVLSSHYEGQPMVVLEARALGLPVISTRFDSVEGSVPSDAGIVVEQSDRALARGMRRFLAGKVPSHPMDCAEYNRQAMRQFCVAIGAEEQGVAAAE